MEPYFNFLLLSKETFKSLIRSWLSKLLSIIEEVEVELFLPLHSKDGFRFALKNLLCVCFFSY